MRVEKGSYLVRFCLVLCWPGQYHSERKYKDLLHINMDIKRFLHFRLEWYVLLFVPHTSGMRSLSRTYEVCTCIIYTQLKTELVPDLDEQVALYTRVLGGWKEHTHTRAPVEGMILLSYYVRLYLYMKGIIPTTAVPGTVPGMIPTAAVLDC